MGKSSPSPPAIPDPSASIAAQTSANIDAARESARLSAIDVNNPYYSTTYTKDSTGLPTAQNTSLSAPFSGIPAQTGALINSILGSGSGIASGLPTGPLDISNVGYDAFNPTGLPNVQPDYSGADVNTLIQSYYDKGSQLLTPEFDRQQRKLEQDLADRGLPLSGEAYSGAMDRYDTQRGQAFQQLADSAIQSGYGESHAQTSEALQKAQEQASLRSQLYGEQQGTRSLNESLSQDAINRAMAQYDLPFSELSKFLGASGGSTPQVQSASLPSLNVLQAPDVQGAQNTAYSQQLNAYNQAQSQRNAGLSGLFQLGATVLPWIFG